MPWLWGRVLLCVLGFGGMLLGLWHGRPWWIIISGVLGAAVMAMLMRHSSGPYDHQLFPLLILTPILLVLMRESFASAMTVLTVVGGGCLVRSVKAMFMPPMRSGRHTAAT